MGARARRTLFSCSQSAYALSVRNLRSSAQIDANRLNKLDYLKKSPEVKAICRWVPASSRATAAVYCEIAREAVEQGSKQGHITIKGECRVLSIAQEPSYVGQASGRREGVGPRLSMDT